MKLRIALGTVLLCLVFAASAEASHWYVTWPQAKHAARVYTREACGEERGCVAYGIGGCERLSSSRFNCVSALWFLDNEGYEQECAATLHIGVSYSGYVEVKSRTNATCRYVE